jgi:replicative DNA helicase
MIPANTKLEGQFLGGLLINNSEFKYIQELFHEELFYDEKNQLIAKAILSLNNASKTIDLINVLNELESTLKINPISFYDLSLLTNDAILNRFDEKILILSEFYIKRKMMYKLADLLEKTQESTSDVFELLADNEKNTNEIFNKISISKTFTALDCAIEMDQHLDKINKLTDGELIGCDTGFSELNKLTAGWQNSDLIILAARPGMGKTSLMLKFVNSVLNQNKSVLVFSLEMSKLQLYARMCSQITSIPLYKFLKEKMNQYERELYKNETFKLSNSQLFIEDKSGISINFIKVKARKLKRDKDISMIVIDYIGLIDKGNNNKSTNDQVAEISGALKGLAKELNIPIILLSQLSREVEKLNDKRPMLSHLRDSGAIEQDADMVMFIYRPEYYGIMDDGAGNSTIGKAELIVAKHRNGALSDIIVNFDGRCTNFYDSR